MCSEASQGNTQERRLIDGTISTISIIIIISSSSS